MYHIILAGCAGHDLFRDGEVPQSDPVLLSSPGTQPHHPPGELVASDHRRLHVAGNSLPVSPEPRGSIVSLGISSTDTNSFNLDRSSDQ